MSKIRVAIAGTVGKSVQFDPNAGARAEAAVAALAAQISAGVGGTIFHSSLRNLQVGNDHPQYAGKAFPETVTGQWNFQTIPNIQGETLAEYIQDVVGADFFDFLQDTSSVVWTYHETANELEANVPPEFVQDTVAAMFPDSDSIDFTYNDGDGTIDAEVVYANPSGLIGMTAANGTSTFATRADATHAIDPAIVPTWTGSHTFNASIVGGSDELDVDSLTVRQEGSGAAQYMLRDSAEGTDEKIWRYLVFGSDFYIQTLNDAENSPRTLLRAARGTGIAIAGIELGNATDNPTTTILGTGVVSIGGQTRVPASTTSAASLRIPHGSAPSSPTNGDMWTTTAGLFVRINGATVGPLS